jgi:hypothetical protein
MLSPSEKRSPRRRKTFRSTLAFRQPNILRYKDFATRPPSTRRAGRVRKRERERQRPGSVRPLPGRFIDPPQNRGKHWNV